MRGAAVARRPGRMRAAPAAPAGPPRFAERGAPGMAPPPHAASPLWLALRPRPRDD